MRQRIRLTESDLRRMVMRVLRESKARTEVVKGVYNVYDIIGYWAEAARKGPDGTSRIKDEETGREIGPEYTAADWKATLYFSNFRKWALGKETGGHGMGGESIKAAIGKEIKSKFDKKSDKADEPNEYVKPDSSFYEDVYSSFFYGSGLNTKSATGMEAEENLDQIGFDAMAPTWLEPKKDGSEKTKYDIANLIAKALQIYAIRYYRFNISDMISNVSGNKNLTDTDNDKDKEQFKGDKLSTTYNTNIGDYDENLDDEQIDSTFDIPDTNSRLEYREKIRNLFEFLLDECNSDIAQFHQGYTRAGGKLYPVLKRHLVNVVEYIVKNFDKLFDEETLDRLIPDTMKAPQQVANIIRKLVAEHVTNDYNDAIRKKQEDPTYTNYILDMFPVQDLNDKGQSKTVKTSLNDPNVAITPTQFQACLREDLNKLYDFVLDHLNRYFWKTIGVSYEEVKPGENLTKRNSPKRIRDKKNPGKTKMVKPSPLSHGRDLLARFENMRENGFPYNFEEPYDRAQYINLYNKLGEKGLMKKFNVSYVPKPKDLEKLFGSSMDQVVNEAIRRIKMLAR